MSIHIESCPTDGFLAGSAIQELSELWHLRGKEVAWQVLFEAFGEQLATYTVPSPGVLTMACGHEEC